MTLLLVKPGLEPMPSKEAFAMRLRRPIHVSPNSSTMATMCMKSSTRSRKLTNLSQFLGPANEVTESSNGIFGRAIRWLVTTIKSEIEVELAQSTRTPIDRRYLMKDDTSDQTRFEG